MNIVNLYLYNYRNIEKLYIEFNKKLNVIYGLNGQGKTNILESIYYLSYLKSFRIYRKSNLIGLNDTKSSVVANISKNNICNKIKTEIEPRKRNFFLNDNNVDILEYFKEIKTVLYSSDDIEILKGSHSVRRSFIDRSIFMFDQSYINTVNSYNLILKSRNKLIKNKVIDHQYDLWTKLLIDKASTIYSERKLFIERILNIASNIFKNVFFEDSFFYLKIKNGINDSDIYRNNLENLYKNKRDREFDLGYTLFGSHLDEYDFFIDDINCRYSASQGQIRSILLSIKIAQVIDYFNKYNEYPILLLDDITSELDVVKLNKLFDFLTINIDQIFVTDTSNNNISFITDDISFFHVKNGVVFPDKP